MYFHMMAGPKGGVDPTRARAPLRKAMAAEPRAKKLHVNGGVKVKAAHPAQGGQGGGGQAQEEFGRRW